MTIRLSTSRTALRYRLAVWLMTAAAAASCAPLITFAHGGEDHGEAEPVTAAPAAVSRVEAASDQFELVGTLHGDVLTLHLDRFATNEPVAGAKIEVEGGPLKATTASEHDAVYSVPAGGLVTPGSYPMVFTVQAGAVSDLLTGDLTVIAASADALTAAKTAAKTSASAATPAVWRSPPVLIGGAVLLALIAAGGIVATRARRGRSSDEPPSPPIVESFKGAAR